MVLPRGPANLWLHSHQISDSTRNIAVVAVTHTDFGLANRMVSCLLLPQSCRSKLRLGSKFHNETCTIVSRNVNLFSQQASGFTTN